MVEKGGQLTGRDTGSEGPPQQAFIGGRRAVGVAVEPGATTGSNPYRQPLVFIQPANAHQTVGG